MRDLKRRISAAVLAAMVMSLLCVSALAAEGGTDTSTTAASVISAFQSGFQTIASDALSLIGAMVPIALSVAGVIFLARKAMSWFKSLAK